MTAVRHRRIATVIGWTVVVLVLLVAGAVISATGLELLLQARAYWHQLDPEPDRRPRFHALEGTYTPYGRMHLHPQYMCFLSSNPRERAADSNATCTIDADHDLEFHDLGNVFDQHFAAIPTMNPDLSDDTIFVDSVHLYDPGNEIVARHLAGFIH